MNISELLNKIESTEILKKDCHTHFSALGFECMIVDIRAAPFMIDKYSLVTLEIPADKRGNLSRFAGKRVEIIPTTVSRGGPRINFYIREKK